MSTPLTIPEITAFPSDIPIGEEGEAMDHALGVFQDLVDRRHVFPSHREQEFRLTVKRP